jgi:hypothetical protein
MLAGVHNIQFYFNFCSAAKSYIIEKEDNYTSEAKWAGWRRRNRTEARPVCDRTDWIDRTETDMLDCGIGGHRWDRNIYDLRWEWLGQMGWIVGMDGTGRMDCGNGLDRWDGLWDWMGQMGWTVGMDGTDGMDCGNGWDGWDGWWEWMAQIGWTVRIAGTKRRGGGNGWERCDAWWEWMGKTERNVAMDGTDGIEGGWDRWGGWSICEVGTGWDEWYD